MIGVDKPVCRVDDNGDPIQGSRLPFLPDVWGATASYRTATHRHHSDGWRNVLPFALPTGFVITSGAPVLVKNPDGTISDYYETASIQAVRDARPTRALEQALLAKLSQLDALIGSSFATAIPFVRGFNVQIAGAIDDFVSANQDDNIAAAIAALRLGSSLQNILMNIQGVEPLALYTEYFGQ